MFSLEFWNVCMYSPDLSNVKELTPLLINFPDVFTRIADSIPFLTSHSLTNTRNTARWLKKPAGKMTRFSVLLRCVADRWLGVRVEFIRNNSLEKYVIQYSSLCVNDLWGGYILYVCSYNFGKVLLHTIQKLKFVREKLITR